MNIQTLADSLSDAQRLVMLGELVEVTPDECDQLEELGLRLPTPRHGKRTDGGMLIWPITPLGLELRAFLRDYLENSDGQ